LSYGIVYCATCTVNGKSYVGQTTDGIKQRWSNHKYDAKRRTAPVSKAIAEYGVSAFDLATLAEADNQTDLDELERLWIATKQSYNPQLGYNRTFGGVHGKPTPEQRAKMSAAKMGRTLSPEHCSATSAGLMGHAVSPESRAKMSAAAKGRALSPEHRAKISAANMGRKATPESRAINSAAHMQANPSPRALYLRAWRERQRLEVAA